MGGYGGASGKTKDKCYRDTGGNKAKDKKRYRGCRILHQKRKVCGIFTGETS